MNGSHNFMIKTIHSLKHRNIPENSFFTMHLHDNSIHSENDTNWSDTGEVRVCEYFGGHKTVCVSKLKVKKIHIKHGMLEKELEVPKDCEVYQAIRSQTTFYPSGEKKDRIVGRTVGLVKDGKVIEEYFLNDVENQIFGMKS